MMITSAAPAAIDPRKPVSLDVEYYTPVLVRTHLGGTPEDFFDQNPTPSSGGYIPCTPEKCGPLPKEIYRNNPVMQPDGTPKLKRMVKHLEDAPSSPLNTGMLWGLIGGASGGTLGILGGAMMGATIGGGVLGAIIGGIAAGGAGAWMARGDRIRLAWDVQPIVRAEYVGYKEVVTPAGARGYKHAFVPDIQLVEVGQYKVPRIEHYRER